MEDALKLLLTYGPGGVIAVLLILGVLVPSKYYDREIKRGDAATQAATHNAEALREVTGALKIATEAISGMREELKTLRAEVASLRRQS